ncbi:PTS sugar transporter subunit IIA [Pantoea sp. 1.19]|uniref:PTS sugar transporter subunit IIA n=1 Tax=Pantoea sp. 1.19 TaxID=1925589 RepID=UPI0009489A7F|nr:PTS sugar transporter subunit IIA [Pantoea sp. 1.19]
MIVSRLSFVIAPAGLDGWRLQQMAQLTGWFQSLVILINFTRNQQAPLSHTLACLTLGCQPHDFCQLAIEGRDADALCRVLANYLLDCATPVTPLHHPPAHPLWQQHPAFAQPFPWRWHCLQGANPGDKPTALAHIAALAAPTQAAELTAQLAAREAVSATALPGQLAFPHVVSHAVGLPTLIALRLSAALDWQAREPVRSVLAVILPAPLSRPQAAAVTRLSRWLIADRHPQLLHDAEHEATALALVLHAMAHGHSPLS